MAAAGLNNEPSIITIIFQGMHKHVISCENCQHESVSFEPFTVLSFALPVSGNCMLKTLLRTHYEDTFITYKCPQCSKEEESFRKTIIQKVPLILVLHLNRFEYAISARKTQNFVDFPEEGLSLRAHILSDKPSASYSLCAVLNHFGALSDGHYTSYCRPSCGNVWCNWDDGNVSRLRKPIKTSATYLLFYNSLQNMCVLLLVPMVLLLVWCEAWGGWGTAWCLWVGGCWVGRDGGLIPGLWWGWWMAVLRQRNVGCRVLWSCPYASCTPSVLYFPCPLDKLSPSHASHTPLCPLFPTITTLVHPRPDAESCCSVSHAVAGC